MMIDILEQKLVPVIYNLQDLYKDHWEEVYGKTNQEVEILFEVYEKLSELDMAFGLFAYFDMQIVGYSINFLTPSLHSKRTFICHNDALFVDPLFRDTPLGLKLIKKTEKRAQEKGCNIMSFNAPLNTNLIKILPRLKYKAIEQVFIKEI